MAYDTWQKLTEFAKAWGKPDLVSFICAEAKVALSPAKTGPMALYRTVNYMPGPLQTQNYVRALCLGTGMPSDWIQRNVWLRMARQSLLYRDRTPQKFLVDEAALINWPGRFSEVVRPQLSYALQELHADSKEDNLLDFRVVPNAHATALPRTIYDDTFSLMCTDTETTGFVECLRQSIKGGNNGQQGDGEDWNQGDIELVGADMIPFLEHSWREIGNMALSRPDSMGLIQAKMREL